MALKDFDDVNPKTRDKNWKEELPVAQMPKKGEWYQFRVMGGVYSYAQHWIEFTNKTGEVKRYPVDCANWDPAEEASTKKGGCPCCELGQRPSIRYMMNAISREAQNSGQDDPVRTLDLAPTVMRQLVDLKKLNVVKGTPYSITHRKYGCDIHLMKQASKKRGGVEWQVQKGDRQALTEEELEFELLDFSDYWLEPDVHKIRADLKRHGYYDDGTSDSDSDSDVDSSSEEEVPKKRKKASKPPAADSDDAVDDEEDEDFEPPRRKKVKKASPPPSEDADDADDEEEEPPRKKVKAKKPAPPSEDSDDEDEDDDDEAPPRRKKAAKKKVRRAPPPADDADDDWDDDDWDED